MRRAGLMWSIAAMIATITFGILHAADPPPPIAADQGAATEPVEKLEAQYHDLLARLGNDDFGVREAAQKDLGRIPWQLRGVLVKLAAAANDPEIKTRLGRRIDEIDDQLAMDPPPISLSLQNASWEQMTVELSKATQMDIGQWLPESVRGKATFSLDAQGQPFWKIMLTLDNQHPIPLPLQNPDLSTEIRLQDCMQNGVIAGGFAVFPLSIRRVQADARMDVNHGGGPELRFSFIVAADPRIKILKIRPRFLTRVVDNKGGVMLDLTKSPSPEAWNTLPANITKYTESIYGSDASGLQIASARGNIHVLLRVGEDQVIVDQPAKGRMVTLAGHAIAITQWDENKNSTDIALALNVEDQGEGPQQPAENPDESVDVTLIDAKDRVIASQSFAGSMNMEHSGGSPFAPPLRLRLVMGTRSKEMDIPFELKDLPLP